LTKYEFNATIMYPSSQSIVKQVFIDFQKYKSDVTVIEEFCEWSDYIEKLFFNIDTIERLRNKSLQPLFSLLSNNSHIQKLIKSHPFAVQAMKEFDAINVLNEKDLIDWLLKYEVNELDYGDYVKIDNWEINNLILHPLDNSVVIDCSGYSESLMFSEVHPKFYWKLFEKYKITEDQYEIAKKEYRVKAFNLRTFLKVQKTLESNA